MVNSTKQCRARDSGIWSKDVRLIRQTKLCVVYDPIINYRVLFLNLLKICVERIITLALFGEARHPPDESSMVRLQGFNCSQESFDSFDFTHSSVSGFNRTVSEVFLHSEHVDPSFRERESNGNIFAWDLTVLPADVARNQHITFKLYFTARYAECGPYLKG